LRIASADASFRRYFRVNTVAGTLIIMDAPPDKEDCRAFVKVASLMREARLNAPEILNWDPVNGFMLLGDLGNQTLMQVLDTGPGSNNLAYFNKALDVLLPWQQISRDGALPNYDQSMLSRELELFREWYVLRHKGYSLDASQNQVLSDTFNLIISRNLAAPKVFVHRDFMPRNLMFTGHDSPLGVLDFQDAVIGPITYDIASLMRDAFISWEEDFVLDVTIRYWERARKLGLIDFDGWAEDFGLFWQAVEWMGLQRHLKVAGIFARLTLRDGKEKYLADSPRFIKYIRSTAMRYKELYPLLRLLDAVEGKLEPTGLFFGRI